MWPSGRAHVLAELVVLCALATAVSSGDDGGGVERENAKHQPNHQLNKAASFHQTTKMSLHQHRRRRTVTTGPRSCGTPCYGAAFTTAIAARQVVSDLTAASAPGESTGTALLLRSLSDAPSSRTYTRCCPHALIRCTIHAPSAQVKRRSGWFGVRHRLRRRMLHRLWSLTSGLRRRSTARWWWTPQSATLGGTKWMWWSSPCQCLLPQKSGSSRYLLGSSPGMITVPTYWYRHTFAIYWTRCVCSKHCH